MKIFEFESTIDEAINTLSNYEKENNVSTRCFEKLTGNRIIGGVLQKPNPF